MDGSKKYNRTPSSVCLTAGEWYVYIIRCTDASLYTGISTDVQRRFAEHDGAGANKGAKYFRGRRPEALVFVEGGHSRATASRREAEIKRLSRQAKLALIASSPLRLKWQ